MKRIWFAITTAVALAVGSGVPTVASPSSMPFHPPSINGSSGTSLNWAGYTAETNLTQPQVDAVSDVSGQWVVPSVNCSTANAYSATWLGIDGWSDNTLEQTGTEQNCVNGQASYSAWFEMYPNPSRHVNMPINAGDTITAEVRYVGNNTFTLSLSDVTASKAFSTTQVAGAGRLGERFLRRGPFLWRGMWDGFSGWGGFRPGPVGQPRGRGDDQGSRMNAPWDRRVANGSVQRAQALWMVEAPSARRILPLANFGTIQFSAASATINGTTGTINNGAWQNGAITMDTRSGTTKAQPSALTSDGSGFSVSWLAN